MDRWPADRLARWQGEQLREAIRHAWARIPAYRDHLEEAGLGPDDIRGLEDIARIPPLDKAKLRRAGPNRYVATDADRTALRSHQTSGSTGTPMEVFMDPAEHSRRAITMLRTVFRLGLIPPRRTLHVGYGRARKFSRLMRRWHSQCTLDEAVATIRDRRPDVLNSMPSTYVNLVRNWVRSGESRPRIRALVSLGEMLTDPVRDHLHDFFRAPIYNIYGANEVGYLAHPCARSPLLHLRYRDLWIEAVRDGVPVPDETEGEALVTCFPARAMPLIRYQLGDRIVITREPCPCGWRGASIRRIEGRTLELLHHADGHVVTGRMSRWIKSMTPEAARSVIQCRIIEEALGHIRVQVVLHGEGADRVPEETKAHFTAHLGAHRVEVERLEVIPPDPNGKIRPIISKVSQRETEEAGHLA